MHRINGLIVIVPLIAVLRTALKSRRRVAGAADLPAAGRVGGACKNHPTQE